VLNGRRVPCDPFPSRSGAAARLRSDEITYDALLATISSRDIAIVRRQTLRCMLFLACPRIVSMLCVQESRQWQASFFGKVQRLRRLAMYLDIAHRSPRAQLPRIEPDREREFFE
jgi:hypothetical protein